MMPYQSTAIISDEEQNLARSYDNERRLGLLERIGLILSITALLVMVDEFISELQTFPLMPWYIRLAQLLPVALLCAMYALTVTSARRKQVRLATLFFTIAVSGLSSLEIFRLSATLGFSPSY